MKSSTFSNGAPFSFYPSTIGAVPLPAAGVAQSGRFPGTSGRLARRAGVLLGALFICVSFLSAQTPHNTLSEDEEKAGYDLLFNGTDKKGWHGYRLRDDDAPSAWVVATDAPLGTRLENRNASGRKQHMLSNKKYTNFDVKVDVKTDVDGNSGIFTRYEEEALSSENARSGPEFQVCGPNHRDCSPRTHSFGSCYFMFGVEESIWRSWYNTPGEWNQVRIIAYDSNYVHYGNGKKLLEYKIGTQEFLQAYNASKYADDGNDGNYYDIHPGSVLLQDHSTKGQAFRNVKAKELKVHPFLQEFKETGTWPDELDQEYVFGKRGCTDSTADNFDPEAEVDDGTCQEVSVNHRAGAEWKARLIRKGGEWNIRLSAPRVSAKLYSISGTEVALRQNGESGYSLSGGVAPGLYVLHVLFDGTPATQMLMVP